MHWSLCADPNSNGGCYFSSKKSPVLSQPNIHYGEKFHVNVCPFSILCWQINQQTNTQTLSETSSKIVEQLYITAENSLTYLSASALNMYSLQNS